MEVKEGYKKTDVGVIPNEWDVKHLGEIGEAIIGLTYKPTDVRSDGTLVLRSSNIQEDHLSFEDNVFVDLVLPDKLIVKNGDILICVRNGSRELIGKCAMIDKRAEKMTFGAFMTIFRSAYNEFVYHHFQSRIIKQQIHEHLGATINQITNKSLNSFEIPLPPTKAEQAAIAEALSNADALIEALEQLIAKKRQVKKGAMQELLIAKRRLPGFLDKSITKNLGSICEIKKGEQLNKDTLSEDDDFPVWNGGIEPSGFTNKWNTEADTLTISEGGNSCGFVNYVRQRFWRGGHCYALDKIDDDISHSYLYQYLKCHEKEIMALRVGSGLPNIQKGRLSGFLAWLPSPEEQTAIAEILSDMDTEIATLEGKLVKARKVKQGMMQELLTGRVRLV